MFSFVCGVIQPKTDGSCPEGRELDPNAGKSVEDKEQLDQCRCPSHDLLNIKSSDRGYPFGGEDPCNGQGEPV